MDRMSDGQYQLFNEIVSFWVEKYRFPTLRELCELLEVKSTQGVRSKINALIRKGWLKKENNLARAICFSDEFMKKYLLLTVYNGWKYKAYGVQNAGD